MNLAAFSILTLALSLALIAFALIKANGKLDFNISVDFSESPESLSVPQANNQTKSENVVDFEAYKKNKPESPTDSREIEKKDEKNLWDDLDRLEEIQQRLSNGNFEGIDADPLDYARRVAERIEDLKSPVSAPQPA